MAGEVVLQTPDVVLSQGQIVNEILGTAAIFVGKIRQRPIYLFPGLDEILFKPAQVSGDLLEFPIGHVRNAGPRIRSCMNVIGWHNKIKVKCSHRSTCNRYSHAEAFATTNFRAIQNRQVFQVSNEVNGCSRDESQHT